MSQTQYLLRFDDICPTMNWRVWTEIEAVLVGRGIKPILAVVPDNRDPVLEVDSPAAAFWDRARSWQDRGWTIALHGYQHLYVSRNAGLAAARKKSEFSGLPIETQREKLRRGMEILEREGIVSRVWIAPGNTFDAATVALLPEFGIDVISAGYFQWPYVSAVASGNGDSQDVDPRSSCRENEVSVHRPSAGPSRRGTMNGRKTSRPELRASNLMVWVPQQMHYFRPAPPGVWTVCYHHNHWSAARLRQFREDVDHYRARIVSLEVVLDGSAPRESKWSPWLCTHPRLAEFLIRGELKLWAMTRGKE